MCHHHKPRASLTLREDDRAWLLITPPPFSTASVHSTETTFLAADSVRLLSSPISEARLHLSKNVFGNAYPTVFASSTWRG